MVDWKNTELNTLMEEDNIKKENVLLNEFYEEKEGRLRIKEDYIRNAIDDMKMMYLSYVPLLYSPSMIALAIHYHQLQKQDDLENEFERYVQYLRDENDIDIALGSLDSIISLSQDYEDVQNSVVKLVVEKLNTIIKITCAACCSVDLMPFLNKANGELSIMESSDVKWHYTDDKSYQIWLPLGKIQPTKVRPNSFQLSPFLYFQPDVFVLAFDISNIKNFEEFKNFEEWKNISHYLVCRKMIVIAMNSELPHAISNEEIKSVLRIISQDKIKVQYLEWNTKTSQINDFISLVNQMIQKK
ncbi:hypothetical protein EDI_046190 [Entamoeba dispar SAW760]|nr:uncharacterized protein EDI_046190 [Entamoeba dispar SAW760]EDR26163.1 hypothetical protein EDI_046190 [Entamoeba dispar SAW760]|eukprot:EDR26163.1 hypothetical protein EDI_046190 [Entamoeba dispar SAW760]